jgi:tetratricopeptide (TPR) repeat protein
LSAQGQLDEAVAKYEAAIALVPDSPLYGAYYFPMGDMLVRLQRYREAATAYRKAVEFVPEHDQAWHSLGQCLLMTGDYEAAAQAFEQSAALVPQDAASWYSAAVAYAKLNDEEHARACLKRALQLQPDWKAQAEQDALLKQYLPVNKSRWPFRKK